MLMKLKKDIFNFKLQFYCTTAGGKYQASPPLSADPSITEGIFLLNIMSKALTYGGDGGGRGGGNSHNLDGKFQSVFPPPGNITFPHSFPLQELPNPQEVKRIIFDIFFF